MGPTDILGYVAGALVLATFTMRTIIPLRMLGIASNIAFMAYGLASHATPIPTVMIIVKSVRTRR